MNICLFGGGRRKERVTLTISPFSPATRQRTTTIDKNKTNENKKNSRQFKQELADVQKYLDEAEELRASRVEGEDEEQSGDGDDDDEEEEEAMEVAGAGGGTGGGAAVNDDDE